MSFLSRLSLANRSAVALATVVLILFGVLVVPLMKQELLPPLTQPTISIVTAYPGAASTQVEQDVTSPLEQNIQGMQGVQSFTSLSSESLSLITVSYDFGTDLDKAQQKLAQLVNRVQPDLPANVIPQLQTFNVTDLPVLTLAVTSTQDVSELGVALKRVVVPALQDISGVGSVTVTGVRQQIVTVNLDSQRLQARGMSINQVENALQANNMSLPAGEVTSNGQTFVIRVGNTFTSIQALQDLVVGVQGSTQQASAQTTSVEHPIPIKLSDVATIQEELAPSSTLTRVNGKPSLGISMLKTPGGNTVSISQELRAQLMELEQKLGHGAQITIIDDQAPLIQTTIAELTREGLLGAGFAILVILVFLLSVRATLVTAISIPLSVLIALIALWTQGYSLNALTLTGLTIAVGRVVDDSIVVLENIYRHLRQGRDKKSSVLAGAQEVAAAVTGSTFTTVAVFLPLAFVGGSIGEQTLPLALTITLALLASLCVALTIIPVLAYWFLKPPKSIREQKGGTHERANILERVYLPLISWVTRHRVTTVILALLLLIGSFALFPLVPVVGYQAPTFNSFTFTQQLASNTSLAQTDIAAQRVEAVLAGVRDIQNYQVTIGTTNAGLRAETNAASFTVTTNAGTNPRAVEQSVRERLNRIPGIGLFSFQDQNNSIDVTVQAADEQALRLANQQVLHALTNMPNTTGVKSDLTEAVPLIDVRVDPARVALYGLTALQVSQELQAIYTGSIVTHMIVNGEQRDVNLTFAVPVNALQEMQNITLLSPLGAVKLGNVASVTLVNEPVQIAHIHGTRSATITLTATSQNYNAVAADVQTRIAALKLPGGATANLGANATLQQSVLNQLVLALALAIPTVFIVLVVTFRSFIQPLILLVAIPFAALGSLVLSAITQTAIGSSTLFGFLMLIGIVVTNAIVLIDRVNYYRSEGMDARAAVIAGGRQRVRPILMTAVATIMALIPMALSGPGNAIISSSLAVVVIGGLASSTFLTLLLVPTLYVIVENTRDRLRKRQDVSSQETGKIVVP